MLKCPYCNTPNFYPVTLLLNVEHYGSNMFHVACMKCGKMLQISARRACTISSVTKSDKKPSEADF